MDDQLQKDIQTQLASLPPELLSAITASDFSSKIGEIAKNNKLLIDQGGAVQMETYLVLLGLQPLDHYIDNLVKDASLSRDKAIKVAHEVDDAVFKNVRNLLMNISKEQIEQEPPRAEEKAPETQTVMAPKEGAQSMPISMPTKESLLSGIESPSTIRTNEQSVSVSILPSNQTKIERFPELIPMDMEVRPQNLPDIMQKPNMPVEMSTVQNSNLPEVENKADLIPRDMETVKKIPLDMKLSSASAIQTETMPEVKIPINKIIPETKPEIIVVPAQTETLSQTNPPVSKNQFDIQPEVSQPQMNNLYREPIPVMPIAVQPKMTSEVIVPREKIFFEEKAKLPEKSTSDPYREPIN